MRFETGGRRLALVLAAGAAGFFVACSGTNFSSSSKRAVAKKTAPKTENAEPEKPSPPPAPPSSAKAVPVTPPPGGPDTSVDSASGEDPGISTTPVATVIPVSLAFQAFQGEAADTNCISVQINDQAPVQVGCNKDGAPFSQQTFQAKSKPECNTIRVIDANVTRNLPISTQDPSHVRWGAGQSLRGLTGFKFFDAGPGVIEGNINDNGDDKDDIDVRFQISGLDAINHTIENSGQPCKP